MNDQSISISISERVRPTPFHSRVLAAGVKSFTVYNHTLLATVFESTENDYWHLLEHVQLWDVSCEKQVAIEGPDAARLVQLMTPRNLSNCAIGQCMYAPLVDEKGRMVNDPVVLKRADDQWWLSVADSDVLLWAMGLASGRDLDVSVTGANVYPLAVQGPKSFPLMRELCGDWIDELRFFRFRETTVSGIEVLIARSGWSKQGGFEIYLKGSEHALDLWDLIFEAGQAYQIRAGCPNFIERVEGGLLSYGNEMTLEHNPFECGLDGFVDLQQSDEILCREALIDIQNQGPENRLIGVEISGAPVAPLAIWTDVKIANGKVGHVASAVYSPRLKKNIAMAMIEIDSIDSDKLQTQIEGSERQLTQVKIPFS